jgi:hypothetical protein
MLHTTYYILHTTYYVLQTKPGNMGTLQTKIGRGCKGRMWSGQHWVGVEKICRYSSKVKNINK